MPVTGVANMTALGNVVSWQKLDYDFEFHRQPFHTNIAVLVFSEGKSLLKVGFSNSIPELFLLFLYIILYIVSFYYSCLFLK